MRKLILASALIMCGLLPARAQVELAFRLDMPEALLMEALPAVVTLENVSGRALRAQEDYHLSFDVVDASGILVSSRAGAQPWQPAVLEPGDAITFTNDLQRLYRLDGAGQFKLLARVRLADRDILSAHVFLDLVSGVELQALRGFAQDGAERLYRLIELNRAKKSRIFFRVDDPASSLCYGVIDLGRYVPLRPPVLRVDKSGFAHVLHLTAPSQFLHSVFSANGEVIAQTVYGGDLNSVRLEIDPDAGYRVVGAIITPHRDRPLDALPSRPRL